MGLEPPWHPELCQHHGRGGRGGIPCPAASPVGASSEKTGAGCARGAAGAWVALGEGWQGASWHRHPSPVPGIAAPATRVPREKAGGSRVI